MYSKDLIPYDYFSLLIERDNSGPSGAILHSVEFLILPLLRTYLTPILITTIEGYPDSYDSHTINIVSIELNGVVTASSGGSTVEYIVDSGTTLNYVPTKVANKINAAFSPAAVYSSADGAYVVLCTSKPPAVSIDIAGTVFTVNPLYMILDAGDGTSISGFMDGGSFDTEDILF